MPMHLVLIIRMLEWLIRVDKRKTQKQRTLMCFALQHIKINNEIYGLAIFHSYYIVKINSYNSISDKQSKGARSCLVIYYILICLYLDF